MDPKTIKLGIIVLILVYATYVLFFKQDKTYDKPVNYGTGIVEQYLAHRLESIRREIEYAEGFMQALSGVSNITPVSDKIKEVDRKYEKLKAEEFKVLSIMKASNSVQ